MAKKKKINLKNERSITETQLGVILEDVSRKFDLILEGQEMVKNEIREEFNSRFDVIDKKFEQIDERFQQIDDKFDLVFEHFSNIEDELVEIKNEIKDIKKNKVDKKWTKEWVVGIERRVRIIERKLEKEKMKTR